MKPTVNTPFITETGEAFEIPEEGSLGLLAVGYSGIVLWRRKRDALAAERAAAQNEHSRKND
jgi:hypothetical protein